MVTCTLGSVMEGLEEIHLETVRIAQLFLAKSCVSTLIRSPKTEIIAFHSTIPIWATTWAIKKRYLLTGSGILGGLVSIHQLEIFGLEMWEKNYGWNIMEGSLTYSSGSQIGLELPVWEYTHSDGVAVVGGYVYRGSSLADLYLKYVYGDFGSGKIWALQYDGVSTPVNMLLITTGLNISSFGVDEQDNLYFCALDGKIYIIMSAIVPTASPTSNSTPVPTSIPFPTPIQTSVPTVIPSSTASSSPRITPTPTPTIPEVPSMIVFFVVVIVATITMIFGTRKNKK